MDKTNCLTRFYDPKANVKSLNFYQFLHGLAAQKTSIKFDYIGNRRLLLTVFQEFILCFMTTHIFFFRGIPSIEDRKNVLLSSSYMYL